MGLISINADSLASITALFNFLSTPSGQNVVEDFRKLNKNVVTWIGDLIGVIHKHHSADITPSIPPSPSQSEFITNPVIHIEPKE